MVIKERWSLIRGDHSGRFCYICAQNQTFKNQGTAHTLLKKEPKRIPAICHLPGPSVGEARGPCVRYNVQITKNRRQWPMCQIPIKAAWRPLEQANQETVKKGAKHNSQQRGFFCLPHSGSLGGNQYT